MEYEIKSISLSSVFKISFMVILTVSCIFVFLITLFAMWVFSMLGDSIVDMPLLQNIDPVSFSLGRIIFASIFNGIFLTVGLMFFVMLIVIFYNIYVSYMGGIVLQIAPSEDHQVIQTKGRENDGN